MTGKRLTIALKFVGLVVLLCYALLLALGFLGQIRAVVYIVIGSIFLAYLIHPAIRRLRERMPLGAAVVLVYGAILVGVVALGWFLIPRVADDVGALSQHYPELAVSSTRCSCWPHSWSSRNGKTSAGAQHREQNGALESLRRAARPARRWRARRHLRMLVAIPVAGILRVVGMRVFGLSSVKEPRLVKESAP